MKFALKNKRVFIYSALALLFIIIAALVPLEVNNFFSVIYLPLKGIGNGIRNITLNKSVAAGWILYFILGLIPLVYPIIKIIIKRKFYLFSLLWLGLSLFVFITLYFFINPHLLNSKLISGVTSDNKITLIGFEVTFIILLIICVLVELSQLLKSYPEKSYNFVKVIIDLFALIAIFSVCFINVLSVKEGFKSISSIEAGAFDGRLNKGLNYFSILLTFILNAVPAVFTVILLLKCSSFVDMLKVDAFNPQNEKPLKVIIKLAKITVLITLASTALCNIALIIMSKWLVNANYQFEIPLVMLCTVCLVIIFSQILIRAIELNEEQKLVI